MNWNEFQHHFLYRGFDRDIRRKTFKALRKFSRKNPSGVIDALPALRIYAPSDELGATISLNEYGVRTLVTLIVLPQILELYSQAEVDFTVAHEFAHVALKHYNIGPLKGVADNDQPMEKAANQLAEEWGFKRPEYY